MSGRLLDAIKDNALGGVFNGVNNVVQTAGQGVNVFAVNRRDKSLIQFLDNLVGEQIAVVLDLFYLVGIGDAVIEIRKKLLQQQRAFCHVRRHAIEQVEIFIFLWQ